MSPDLPMGGALQGRHFWRSLPAGSEVDFHADEEPQFARFGHIADAARQRLRRTAIARLWINRLNQTARRRLAPIGPIRVVDAIAIQDAFHRADVSSTPRYQQRCIRRAAEANAIRSAAE
jgi:hypothetical protein